MKADDFRLQIYRTS